MTRHTHEDVISAFTADKPGVEGENLKTIETDSGNTALIGYDRAVYAIKEHQKIRVFFEWRKESKTSNKHLQNLLEHLLDDTAYLIQGVDTKLGVGAVTGDKNDE